MNVYGNASLRAKQKANSKVAQMTVVQMTIAQPKPKPENLAIAV